MTRATAPNSSHRTTAGEALEYWLTTLYTRHKRRYLHIVLAFVTVVTVVLVIPISAFLCFSVLGPVRGIAPVMEVVFVASVLTAPPIIFGVVLYRHRMVVRWFAGSDDDPIEVWRSVALEAPKTVLIIDTACGVCVAVPGFFAMRQYLGTPVLALLEVMAIGITFLGSLAFWLLVIDLVWRPAASDVGRHLPRDFRSASMGQPMQRRLLPIMLMLVLFTGIAAIDLSSIARSPIERLVLGIGATVLVSLTVSGLLAALLRHSILGRIEMLKSALQAVRFGHDDVRLYPVAGDELDAVGEAFNDMVDRLTASEQETLASRARIVAVADEERRRMERDLHDGAQQYLALMGLQVSSIDDLVDSDPARAHAELAEMKTTLADAQIELRNLAHGIYPATLETEGLAAALSEAGGRATVPVSVASDGVRRLPREVEAAVYFCCLEALQNVSKYAGEGATATVSLAQTDHRVEFTVSDNGVGFDVEAKGHGLVNMQDRIGALGGEVTVSSAPGKGTTVGGWVPVG